MCERVISNFSFFEIKTEISISTTTPRVTHTALNKSRKINQYDGRRINREIVTRCSKRETLSLDAHERAFRNVETERAKNP